MKNGKKATYIFIIVAVFKLFNGNKCARGLILSFIDDTISPEHSTNKIQIRLRKLRRHIICRVINITIRHNYNVLSYPTKLVRFIFI